MRTILFLLKKEFLQIIRNKALLPVTLIMPIVQLLITPLAADYEIKNVLISIVDHDHSSYSQKLTSKIMASQYFILTDYGDSYDKAFKHIENGTSDLILEIPEGFERNLVRENKQHIFIAVNAINGIKANLGGAYLGSVIRDFNTDIRAEWTQIGKFNPVPVIGVASTNWFNIHMNYNIFMVPGILVILVTMVGTYLCSLNIVKEKEVGTIEQINVSPIKKYHFILGKLIPFWITGIFIFTIGLFFVGRWVYGIIPLGSVWLLYGYLSLYLIALLGFGLLLSTYAETQQQAMSLSFFFMMIFIMMSGLFTPIDSMPDWAITLSKFNPVTYFIEVIRMIVMKGSGFSDIKHQFLIMALFAFIFNYWAIMNYKKTN